MKIRTSEIFSALNKIILKFIRPSSNSICNCHSPNGIRLITRFRFGLSHLREHKFCHNFQDILNPLCSCVDDIETTIHYLLHCPTYSYERRTLLDKFQSIGENIPDIKMISKSQNCFYLTFLQIMMHQIHVFWMLPSITYWLLKYLTSLLLTLKSFETFAFFNTYVNSTVSNNNSLKIWW